MKPVSGRGDSATSVDSIDLAQARRKIDALVDTPATVRARAFYVYAGLAEIAEPDGLVPMLANEFIPLFELNRASWNTYRKVLTEAGLISTEREGRSRPVRLLVSA
jgi:hypothetical protein